MFGKIIDGTLAVGPATVAAGEAFGQEWTKDYGKRQTARQLRHIAMEAALKAATAATKMKQGQTIDGEATAVPNA